MRKFTACLFILSQMILPVQAESDYYIWVDANGVTNYAAQKPNDHEAKHITTNRSFGQNYSSENPEQLSDTPTRKAKDRPSEQDKALAQTRSNHNLEVAAAKRSNCQIGRRNLAKLEEFARIRLTDEKGGSRILSDDERTARLNKANKTIKENCNG
ncbi:MAG: DUF4124 domain-containing protein [Pseudomonadales bacterium]|nr:DUF4124 domain-containing protein [Pseudomonadales bacterium]